jgi:hypothetical protein
LVETKKSINHKSNIKIKFRSHHWISDNKNFETRSHLTIFWQTFFIHIFNYGYIFCYRWNKTNEVREQTRITVRTSLYVISNNKYSVRTNRNKRVRHMLLLWTEKNITIAKTSLYVILKKVSEQMRTNVRTQSDLVGTILFVISNKNKCSIRINQNKGRNKLLL